VEGLDLYSDDAAAAAIVTITTAAQFILLIQRYCHGRHFAAHQLAYYGLCTFT
jgi:hypothetical protein